MHLIHKLSAKSISHVRVERGTNAGLIVTLYKHFHMLAFRIYKISYYFLAISSLGYIEKKCAKVKKSFEDIAEHLFNYCKSTFLAEVNLSSRFLAFI